jgi:hypothetical protein
MKKLMLALGLVALGVACRASSASVHDTSSCTGKDCADCAAMMEGDCSKTCTPEEMAECRKKCEGEAQAQVCPVTGKSMN